MAPGVLQQHLVLPQRQGFAFLHGVDEGGQALVERPNGIPCRPAVVRNEHNVNILRPVDPPVRLDADQALELAFLIAERLKQRRDTRRMPETDKAAASA